MKAIANSRPLLVVIVGMMGLRLGSAVSRPILPLFVQSLVPSGAQVASTSGLITGVAAATGALGAVIIGRASDRLGYRSLMLGCLLGSALLYVPQSLVTNPLHLLLLRALSGLTIGGALPTSSAVLARLAPEGHQGAVYGVNASARSAGSALGPLLGAAVAASNGLRASFLASAAVFGLVALWVAGFIPKPDPRQGGQGSAQV